MRTAPPADYPVSNDGPWHFVAGLLLTGTVAVVAAWLALHLHRSAPVPAASAACAAGLLLWLGHRRRTASPTRLRWDGQAWRLITAGGLPAEGAPGSVRVVLDLGNGLLLRWAQQGGAGARLLPLWRARDQVPSWHALRVAVRAARAAP